MGLYLVEPLWDAEGGPSMGHRSSWAASPSPNYLERPRLLRQAPFRVEPPPASNLQNLLRQGKSRGFTWGDPDRDDDFYVFDASPPTSTPSTTPQIPGMGTTQTACEDACMTTHEYNPVCGDDGHTYYNGARLSCARKCGKEVVAVHGGACSRKRS